MKNKSIRIDKDKKRIEKMPDSTREGDLEKIKGEIEPKPGKPPEGYIEKTKEAPVTEIDPPADPPAAPEEKAEDMAPQGIPIPEMKDGEFYTIPVTLSGGTWKDLEAIAFNGGYVFRDEIIREALRKLINDKFTE